MSLRSQRVLRLEKTVLISQTLQRFCTERIGLWSGSLYISKIDNWHNIILIQFRILRTMTQRNAQRPARRITFLVWMCFKYDILVKQSHLFRKLYVLCKCKIKNS